jgi:hypothetical protein
MTTGTSANTSAIPSVGSMQEAEILITHLLDVMDAMLGVVDDETKLVRAGKLSAAARLVPAKTELSQLYVSDTQRIKASQPFISRTAPNILAALRKRHDEFQAVLQMNLTVLATAHAVSEGIMRGVADELNRKSTPTVYGATGRHAAPSARHAQPLTVSRSL